MDRPIRSLLFIPGDSEKKIAKAPDCGADVVIFDLEDAVAPENKSAARELVFETLTQTVPEHRAMQYWVRVNPLDTGMTKSDLAAVMAGRPDGIVQPKTDGPGCVRQISDMLDALEREHGIQPGLTGIIPVATETARAPFHLGEFADAGLDRLVGLTWGAEDLATAIGASGNRLPDGQWHETFRMVRSLTLLAAHAAEAQAIDTLYADFRDLEGLKAESELSRSEGFSGRLAIHPAQVAVINQAYSPSLDDVAHAREVIAAFANNPGAGTVGLDGKMLDIPHLKQAERIMALADAYGIV
ncbi:HpcH/HpaI aldolase/citrate lyase family protein [Altererythrobacter sp. MF3-039]|uniref:HpcH/HpaI aldolase/citrate lyase family protein n=1 Tax=Altererythrobacter sp. MF3-039 TaxID=3252901 RepID=UPI00390CC59D